MLSDNYLVNVVHCGASVSELYGVFVLHRQLNIFCKALHPKVLMCQLG